MAAYEIATEIATVTVTEENQGVPMEPQGEAVVRLSHILTEYRDQEGVGWPACFAWLRTYHPERIADVTARIVRGDDMGEVYLDPFGKRVLDGHHRLAAWQALGWAEVDVIYAAREDVA